MPLYLSAQDDKTPQIVPLLLVITSGEAAPEIRHPLVRTNQTCLRSIFTLYVRPTQKLSTDHRPARATTPSHRSHAAADILLSHIFRGCVGRYLGDICGPPGMGALPSPAQLSETVNLRWALGPAR